MNPVSRNSASIDEVIPISKVHQVDIPSASRTPSAQALPLNLPCQDLLDDIALRVVNDQPKLALDGGSVLRVLAQKPEAFDIVKSNVIVSTMRRLFDILNPKSFTLNHLRLILKDIAELHWTDVNVTQGLTLLRLILKDIAEMHWTEVQAIMRGTSEPIKEENTTMLRVEKPIDARTSSVLFLAAEAGNVDFIVKVIEQYPELLQEKNDINQSIFHVAVSHRHGKIFGLLYEIGSSCRDSIVTLEDVHGNNMLHLVGKYHGNSSVYIPGAAYELQRELEWFKVVERIIPLSLREKKNACGHTPREEFTNHHKHLVSEGEKWLKETGAQLMVVAALLATISFAASITFAGGYNQTTGNPIFRESTAFPFFLQSCFIAFFCSIASIINVLSLLTSRYAEEDFEKLLPTRMMLSILPLLISIASTVEAFLFNFALLTEKNPIELTPNIPFYFVIVLLIVSSKQLYRVVVYLCTTSIRAIYRPVQTPKIHWGSNV